MFTIFGACFKTEDERELNYYKKAIQKNVDDFDAFLARAELQEKLGYYEKAIEDYSEVTQRAHTQKFLVKAFLARGILKEKLDYSEKAIEDYSEVIQRAHSDSFEFAKAMYNRAKIEFELGRYKDALQDIDAYCTHFLKGNPDCGLLYWRGLAKEKLGHYKEAICDYDKALDASYSELDKYYKKNFKSHTNEMQNYLKTKLEKKREEIVRVQQEEIARKLKKENIKKQEEETKRKLQEENDRKQQEKLEELNRELQREAERAKLPPLGYESYQEYNRDLAHFMNSFNKL